MQLFCPACQAAFPRASRCPRCGGLLLMSHEVAPDVSRRPEAPPPLALPTPAGRVAVGTVLALGLYLALRKLATGAVAAADSDPAGWWLSFGGLTAVYAAQALAIAFGAAIAAAGQPRGYSIGLIVGGVCGTLFLVFELAGGAPPRDLVLYLQPPLLALFGLVTGAAGSRVWPAAPDLNFPVPNPSKLSSLQLGVDLEVERPRPTLWLHIIGGAVVMILGVAVADQVRVAAQKNSGGLLRVQSLGQGEFITWQLATFAVLLGGVAAGAGTGAGIRHGVIAGALGGVGVFAVCAKHGEAVVPVAYWLSKMSLGDLPLTDPGVVAAIAGGVLYLGILGGWLGGTLFLPLAPAHMRPGRIRGAA